MKSKRSSSEAITKGYLKKELARLATKDELGSLGRRIDFKLDGLDKKFDIKLDTLGRKFDVKLDTLKEEIDENAKKYRDDVLVKLDEVMGELQTRREERAIETHQYSELVGQAENH